jgi:hypothetical protein
MLKNIFGLVNNTQNPTPNSPQYITNNKNTNISPETVKKMNVFYKIGLYLNLFNLNSFFAHIIFSVPKLFGMSVYT